ncbi:MAG: hypothetical protein ACM3NH_02695 [Candidatus Saccharibacteria bacterium]
MSATLLFREFNREKIEPAWEDVLAAKGTPEFDPELSSVYMREDRVPAMSALFAIDKKLLDQHSRSTFAMPLKLDFEALLEKLFEKALGIKLPEQDFFPNEAVAGIPLELWVDLFKGFTPQVVEQMKKECQRKNFPFDMFKDFLMGIKNVVKFCLDNNSAFVGYYSTAPGAFLRLREEKYLARLRDEVQ